MTTHERHTLDAFRAFVAEHGRSPSVREVMVARNCSSTRAIHDQLRALVRQGRLMETGERTHGLALANPLENFSTDDLVAELASRGALNA